VAAPFGDLVEVGQVEEDSPADPMEREGALFDGAS
jgi:hypothetical protein